MLPLTSETGPDVRLQVVVAHPDDETFGCGSILLHAHAAGATTAVVCATRGEAGQVTPGVEVPEGDLARAREAELRAAAELMGVAHVDVLDFGDSDMSGAAGEATLVGADPALVERAVADAIDRFDPHVLITLDGSDGHRDHARIRDATIAVARARALPVYLQCIPRSLMRRWADHMQQLDPGNTYLHLGELGTPDEQLTTVVDVGEHLEARWRAIRAHRTQTSPFDALPEDLAAEFLGHDHLMLVH